MESRGQMSKGAAPAVQQDRAPRLLSWQRCAEPEPLSTEATRWEPGAPGIGEGQCGQAVASRGKWRTLTGLLPTW